MTEKSDSEQEKPGVYNRLRNIEDNGYLNVQFQKPASKTPWKAISLALFLGIAGTILLICSLINFWGDEPNEVRARSTAFLILGLIMFVPGIYHIIIAFLAWNQYPGYSFDDIIEME